MVSFFNASKKMDREVCVLIYSQYSIASQKLVDYIKILPYDFAAVTGMTFLPADTQNVRDILKKELNVDEVPCLYIKYFDGRNVMYQDTMIYKFIDSVTRSFIPQNPPQVINDVQAQQQQMQPQQMQPQQMQQQMQPSQTVNLENDSELQQVQQQIQQQMQQHQIPASFIKRDKIMEAATEMFKQREESEKLLREPLAPTAGDRRTIL